MQQSNSNNKHEPLMEMDDTKPASSVNAHTQDRRTSFDSLKKCIDEFYSCVDYESKSGFHRGYSCVVGEDFTNIDLMCNMYDIIYDYITNNDTTLSKVDKKHFRTICDGIKNINKGLTQYDDKQLDKILISTMLGYILKITRNYFHD